MIPIAHSDLSLGQPPSPPSSGSGLWLIILLVIVGIVVALVAGLKTVSPPASVKTAQLELERVQTEVRLERERKEALKRQIQAKLSLTESKFAAFLRERQALEAQFLSVCDVPFEQAHEVMSRRIARRILGSKGFSATYTRLVNLHIPKASLAQPKDQLGRVAGDIFINAVGDSQAETLDEVLNWIEAQNQVLQEQRRILDQLRQASL